jgi:hypothetical protein
MEWVQILKITIQFFFILLIKKSIDDEGQELCNVHNHARNMYYAKSCINLVKTSIDGGGPKLCNVQNHAKIM